MTTGEVLREVILAGSGFAIGVLFLLSYRSFVRALKGPERSGHFALCIARLCTVVVIALIAEAVYHTLEIPPSWRAWIYSVALTGIALGYAWALHKYVAPE